MKIFEFFLKYMDKMVGARAEIFGKLEPELHKNGSTPQHCLPEDLRIFNFLLGGGWYYIGLALSSPARHKSCRE
jgi:hypothetical protein